MNHFTDNFTSLSWWLGIILVGIVLNIISAYLKWPLDRLLSKLFRYWQQRSQKSQTKRAELIQKLTEDTHCQTLFLFRELRHRSQANLFMLLSILFLLLYVGVMIKTVYTVSFAGIESANKVFSTWELKVLLLFSIFLMFISMSHIVLAGYCRVLFKEVRKLKGDNYYL
jgi:hypothetical protein